MPSPSFHSDLISLTSPAVSFAFAFDFFVAVAIILLIIINAAHFASPLWIKLFILLAHRLSHIDCRAGFAELGVFVAWFTTMSASLVDLDPPQSFIICFLHD